MGKRIFTVLIALGFITLVGCNTIEGAGKDIEKGGQKIEDAASKSK